MSEHKILVIGSQRGNIMSSIARSIIDASEKSLLVSEIPDDVTGQRPGISGKLNKFCELYNVKLCPNIPDHTMLMINQLPSPDLKDFATDYFKKLIEKGEIVVAQWPVRPPIEQKEENGKITYHLTSSIL